MYLILQAKVDKWQEAFLHGFFYADLLSITQALLPLTKMVVQIQKNFMCFRIAFPEGVPKYLSSLAGGLESILSKRVRPLCEVLAIMLTRS